MKLKKFIDIYVPTTVCNLRCHYCYISLLNEDRDKSAKTNKNIIAKIQHTPDEIRKALSIKRLGGVCVLNMCAGGETLLSEDILPIAKALCEEGHYVMLVTNGTVSNRMRELESWPEELRKHLFLKISLHYLELLRLNMLHAFAENVVRVKNAGYSITVEITPSDELIPYINELKEFCMKNFGALCHCTIARDDRKQGIDILSSLSKDEYENVWEQMDSELFRYKMKLYKVKRKEYCYAGAWTYYLDLQTGDVRQCYCGNIIDNIYENISKPIRELPIGKKCSLAYCYNGHAFMAFGDIPQLLEDVSYAQLRDRLMMDGNSWLQPEMREIMECKLCEDNKEYTDYQKLQVQLFSLWMRNKELFQRGCRKIKNIFKGN